MHQQHTLDGSRPTDTAVQPCVGLWSLIGCPTSTPSRQQPPEATNKAAPRGSAACDSPLAIPVPDYGCCGYPAPIYCCCPAAAVPLLPPSQLPLLSDGENHQLRATRCGEAGVMPVLTQPLAYAAGDSHLRAVAVLHPRQGGHRPRHPRNSLPPSLRKQPREHAQGIGKDTRAIPKQRRLLRKTPGLETGRRPWLSSCLCHA